MNILYVSLPYIQPSVGIECCDKNIITYLYNMFFPYVSWEPQKQSYTQLKFFKNSLGELFVRINEKDIEYAGNVVRYVETFFLKKAVLSRGYLMLHGGTVELDGKAYVFLGDSFAGKSTTVAYFCKNLFNYVTDDRTIVNTYDKYVIPFPKTIMLRPGTKEMLKEHYNTDLQCDHFKSRKIERDFFKPNKICTRPMPLKSIFILERREGVFNPSSRNIRGAEKIKCFFRYSLITNSIQQKEDIVRLNSVEVQAICYSDLNKLLQFLKENFL